MFCRVVFWVFYVLVVGVFAQPYQTEVHIKGREAYLKDFVELPNDTPNPVVATLNRPGQKIILEPKTLLHIAAQANIPLTLDPHLPIIKVEREARHLRSEDIEKIIQEAWVAPENNLSLKLDHGLLEIFQSVLSDPKIIVENLEIKDSSFSATLNYFIEADQTTQLKVRGKVVTTQEIPVLKRDMRQGEKITKDDLVWQKVDRQQIQVNHFIALEDMIGKEVSPMTLKAGKPLRKTDLKSPVVIQKGALVTAQIKKGGLLLALKVQALESGGLGDTIQVKNIDSKKVITGIVKDAQRVEIPLTLVAESLS